MKADKLGQLGYVLGERLYYSAQQEEIGTASEEAEPMDRGAKKRRLTWFEKRFPGASTTRGLKPAEGQVSRWPTLPKWPPLPGGAISTIKQPQDSPAVAPGEATHTEEQLAPPWEQPAAGQSKRPEKSLVALWGWLSAPSRRRPLGLAAVAATVILTALLAVVLLGGVLRAHTPNMGSATPATGSVANTLASPTISLTPAATTTSVPATPTPPPPFTLTITCASGSIGGRGMVCAHTLPNVSVSLTVRYCDGSYAQGKGLHGKAQTDGSGNYTWRWNVATKCAGSATATVTAKSSGRTVTQSTTFTITR